MRRFITTTIHRGYKVSTIVEAFITSIGCGANRFMHTEVTHYDRALGKIKKLIIFVLPQREIIRQQVYHSNAKRNLNIRFQLQHHSGINSELASRFQV